MAEYGNKSCAETDSQEDLIALGYIDALPYLDSEYSDDAETRQAVDQMIADEMKLFTAENYLSDLPVLFEVSNKSINCYYIYYEKH